MDEKKIDWAEIGRKLREPLPEHDVEWRVQSWSLKPMPWAMVLAYPTNRAIQNRLDATVGPENWHNEFKPGPNGGVLCGITIHGITKWDGADNTDIEGVKGGLSDSMKRAAVEWGIFRYGYYLEANFAECSQTKKKGWRKEYNKADKTYIWWKEPDLPEWARPGGDVESVLFGTAPPPRAELPDTPEPDPPEVPGMDPEKAVMFNPDAPDRAGALALIPYCSTVEAVLSIYKQCEGRAISEGWKDDLITACAERKALLTPKGDRGEGGQ